MKYRVHRIDHTSIQMIFLIIIIPGLIVYELVNKKLYAILKTA